MATQDSSRNTRDPRFNHRGVRGQTGRIITDEDISAIDDLVAEERRADRLGIIGVHGTSNQGYLIENAQNVGGSVDFTIRAGDYWIGGLRAALTSDQTFRLQTDWLQHVDVAAPGAVQQDLAVLEVWHQVVSGVENEALLDPALAGADTTARMRVMARVRLLSDLEGEDCHELWQQALTDWQDAGIGVLASDHELAGDGVLTVGFGAGGDADDLCAPSIAQGFLGAANRAIRVQMVTDDSFCWGFEDGGRLMRATISDANTLTLLSEPKDDAHWPAPNQIIQILPWGAVEANGEKLAGELDESHFTRVDAGYDPDTGQLTLQDALPAGFGDAWQTRADAADLMTTRFGLVDHDVAYVFVRVWDRGEDRASDPALPVAGDVALGLTGLTVNIAGNTLRPGDSWEIAARPHAPDEIAAWDLRVGKSYDQYRRFVAPLAHLIWDGSDQATVIDCRTRFRPLTRLNDCVTLRVGDGTTSHGDYLTISAAVAALPPAGGRILVLPGEYDERVLIEGRRDIRIEGCGRRTRVIAPDDEDDAVFHLSACEGIDIRDLAIAAPDQLAVLADSSADRRGICRDIGLRNLDIQHFQRGAVAYAAVIGGHVTDCRMLCEGVFVPDDAPEDTIHRPAVFLQGRDLALTDSVLAGRGAGKLATALGGVQIGGGSQRITIRGNQIGGCYGHGITLGSVSYVAAAALGSDAIMSTHYVATYGSVGVYYGFWLTDDNCFGLDPERPPRDPETGDDLEPVSDGPLRRIHIEENEIRGMGGCGISVVRFFDLVVTPEFISVDDLTILRNRIEDCLVGENVAFPAAYNAVAAWGAIALGDVSRVEIRENQLTGCGRVHPIATTGIFALFAEDFNVIDNRIQNNGQRADEMDGIPGGWRGGVVIGQVRPSPGRDPDLPPGDDDDGIRTDGGVSLRIHGNTIVAPQGRAVTAFGLGPMTVTDNRLTTQSGGLNGWLVAAAGIKTRTLSFGALLLSIGFVGLREAARPNMLSGHAILSALGGEVLALGNSGFSSELYLQQLGLSQSLVQSEDDAFDYQGDLMTGGDLMINDNQIRMDGLDGEFSASISAIVALSLDSVMFQDNQVSLDLNFFDFVAIDLLALGWSVHVSGNRLKEPLINCFLSALTIALMNTTALNQATHCVLAYGPAKLRYDAGNTELIELLFNFDKPLCDMFRESLFKLDRTFFKTSDLGGFDG